MEKGERRRAGKGGWKPPRVNKSGYQPLDKTRGQRPLVENGAVMFSVPTWRVLQPYSFDHLPTFAMAIRGFYEDDLVSSMSEVSPKGKESNETRVALVGDDYADDVRYELNELIMELTRPNGLVHSVLDNGHELCTTRVLREKVDSDNGSSYLERVTVRFMSDDPDVVMMYRITPALAAYVASGRRAATMAAEAVEHIPAIAGRLPRAIAAAQQKVAAELTTGSEE
jgi:hypothetical protein